MTSSTHTADDRIRIMLVEDSAVARAFILRVLEADERVEVVGVAENGKLAIETAAALNPDVILLDIAMPEMDGLTALPYLLARVPRAKVLILSGLTKRYAELGMSALQLGASDILEKPSASDDASVASFSSDLHYKIKVLAGRSSTSVVLRPSADEASVVERPAIAPSQKMFPNILAIASSTGGPHALLELFTHLHEVTLRVPVLITQHMPAAFTSIFAGNLHKASGMPCHEATHEQVIMPGHIYVAPGDYHMTVRKHLHERHIMLNQEAPENFCRPSADPMLRSVVDVYGGDVLFCVLTGMGHDGLAGAKILVEAGGQVLVQERASCAVWGMPKAVHEAGLDSGELSIMHMAKYIREVCC